MNARSLAELTFGLVAAPAEVMVTDVTLDSREATPGALFLACRGLTHHGLEFAPQAVERGARAVLFEAEDAPTLTLPRFAGEGADRSLPRSTGEGWGGGVPLSSSQVFVAAVPELGRNVGTIAARFFGAPSQAMHVAGFTGTNGKTTSAYLLAQALTFSGKPAGYMGTLGFGMPTALQSAAHTTSDAVSVQRQLDTLRKLGASCVAMEVSSHALDQSRVDGVQFHTAVFTNLTRDHLDYHGTMQAYAASKALLFAWPKLAVRVINIDDAFGAQLAAQSSSARLVVTTRNPCPANGEFVRARQVAAQSNGLVIDIQSSWGDCEIRVPLVGDFNVDNVLVVLAVLLAADVSLADAATALAQCRAPSGRMETFGGDGTAPLLIVDYAHTPDALGKALRAARSHCRGKLKVVFGCGGDRDKGKRPLMGAIAAANADDIIITDDNPRTEDPRHIISEIRAGIEPARAVQIEPDRARAIQGAFEHSAADDVVLIAGKGHEDYQIYGHESRPFSDQAVVRELLKRQACSAR